MRLLRLRFEWRAARVRLLRWNYCQPVGSFYCPEKSWFAGSRVYRLVRFRKTASLQVSADLAARSVTEQDLMSDTLKLRQSGGNALASISFWGGVGTVTGSKYLSRNRTRSVLIDCGMFQGLKELRERNWQDPPFDRSSPQCGSNHSRAHRSHGLSSSPRQARFQWSSLLLARHRRPAENPSA